MNVAIPNHLCTAVTNWEDAQEPEFSKEDHERDYDRIHELEDDAVHLLSHLANAINRTEDQPASGEPVWTICFDWGYPHEAVDPVFVVLIAPDKETAREQAIPLIDAECPGILGELAAEDAVYGIATFTGDVTGQLTGDAIIIHGFTLDTAPSPAPSDCIHAPTPRRNLLQRIFRKVLPAQH